MAGNYRYVVYGQDNRGCYMGSERLWSGTRRTRITSSCLRNVPCPRSEFSTTSCRDGEIWKGEAQMGEEEPGIGACCHSGVLSAKKQEWPALWFMVHPDSPWLGSYPNGLGRPAACWRSSAQMQRAMLTIAIWKYSATLWNWNGSTATTGRSKASHWLQVWSGVCV